MNRGVCVISRPYAETRRLKTAHPPQIVPFQELSTTSLRNCRKWAVESVARTESSDRLFNDKKEGTNRGMSTLLDIHQLTKAYPGVVANDRISFSIGPGEIHALLGENGAGKSTLVKMIYGLVRPDHGRMTLNGAAFAPQKPGQARQSGVAMVFQHFSLFEALTVAENIALGMQNPPRRRALNRQIAEVSQSYGLPLDPNRLIGDLSAGERQRVEIIRCLLQNPRLLIMDEPTSVLTPQEVETLFRTLRKLKSEGVSILYISHKLSEIQELCDHATILRGGQVVETCVPRNETPRSLAEMMIGASLARPRPRKVAPGRPVLEVRDLAMTAENQFSVSLKDVCFDLRASEILGIGGVAGNGQEELVSALSGERKAQNGIIWLEGRDIIDLDTNARRQTGLLTAPEERLGHAAAPDMSLTENALLSARVRERLDLNGFIKRESTENFAKAIISKFDVRTTGPDQAARALSGGNLQKFVVGREILQRPRVLVINQPTWGVDAAAAAAIREAIRNLADEGSAVLVVSQDLDELMELADTIAILADGRLSEPAPIGTVTIEAIGQMMEGKMGEPRVQV